MKKKKERGKDIIYLSIYLYLSIYICRERQRERERDRDRDRERDRQTDRDRQTERERKTGWTASKLLILLETPGTLFITNAYQELELY